MIGNQVLFKKYFQLLKHSQIIFYLLKKYQNELFFTLLFIKFLVFLDNTRRAHLYITPVNGFFKLRSVDSECLECHLFVSSSILLTHI